MTEEEYNQTIFEQIPFGTDIKTPCESCPFRNDIKIGKYAGNYGNMLLGTIGGMEKHAHSCHKTDPRSDYKNAKLMNGKIQHCAGFAIMAKKSSYKIAYEIEGLDMQAPVHHFYGFVNSVCKSLRQEIKK